MEAKKFYRTEKLYNTLVIALFPLLTVFWTLFVIIMLYTVNL